MSGGRSVSVGVQHAAPLPHRHPSARRATGRLCLPHEARPVRHRWHAPLDRRRRPPGDPACPRGRDRYRGAHRDLPLRWEDRPADRAGSPVARGVCRRYVDHLRTELERPAQTTRLMVGIADLLAALEPSEARREALVGLLTGNVAQGAVLKLRSAGLDPARFCVGAYGSDSARRADLPAVAAARATALAGASFAGSDVIIVGDTPDDVACGRPIGARSLAVATGSYDVAALRATGATYVFETLADTAAVLDAIFA